MIIIALIKREDANFNKIPQNNTSLKISGVTLIKKKVKKVMVISKTHSLIIKGEVVDSREIEIIADIKNIDNIFVIIQKSDCYINIYLFLNPHFIKKIM